MGRCSLKDVYNDYQERSIVDLNRPPIGKRTFFKTFRINFAAEIANEKLRVPDQGRFYFLGIQIKNEKVNKKAKIT